MARTASGAFVFCFLSQILNKEEYIPNYGNLEVDNKTIFWIRLLGDKCRNFMCMLTLRLILRFYRLHQFPQCLSKAETHLGLQRFEVAPCEFYGQGCKFRNSPSVRSGVLAQRSPTGGRPTDSGAAKVGTAGNIGEAGGKKVHRGSDSAFGSTE